MTLVVRRLVLRREDQLDVSDCLSPPAHSLRALPHGGVAARTAARHHAVYRPAAVGRERGRRYWRRAGDAGGAAGLYRGPEVHAAGRPGGHGPPAVADAVRPPGVRIRIGATRGDRD